MSLTFRAFIGQVPPYHACILRPHSAPQLPRPSNQNMLISLLLVTSDQAEILTSMVRLGSSVLSFCIRFWPNEWGLHNLSTNPWNILRIAPCNLCCYWMSLPLCVACDKALLLFAVEIQIILNRRTKDRKNNFVTQIKAKNFSELPSIVLFVTLLKHQ